MALTPYALPTIEAISGDYNITLYCDVASLTVPTAHTILGISEVKERPEDSVGVFEIATMTVDIQDDTSTYAQGFWYKVMNDATEVQLKVIRDTDADSVCLFWGYSINQYVVWEEFFNNEAAFIRRGRFTMVSMLGKLRDASLSSILTEFHTHDAVCDQPEVAGLAVVKNGLPGSLTHGYSLRAVYGNGGSSKCTEVQVTAQDTLGGVTYNSLSWTSVPGATAIIVYRDTVSPGDPGGYGTGQIRTLAGTATSTTDDGVVASADGYSASGYKYGLMHSLFASMVKIAYSQAYTLNDAEFLNPDEIYFRDFNTDSFDLEDVAFQTHDGTSYRGYFDAGNDAYWPNRYDPLQLLGALCRNFGFMARHYYNVTYSAHRVQLITRGQSYPTAITIDGDGFTESGISNGFDLTFQGIEVSRYADKLADYLFGTAATNEAKVTITSTAHGYANGDFIQLDKFTPETLNVVWEVENVAANTLDLVDSRGYSSVSTATGIIKRAQLHRIVNGAGGANFKVRCEFVAVFGVADTGVDDIIYLKNAGATGAYFAPTDFYYYKYSTAAATQETSFPKFFRMLAKYYQDRFNAYGKLFERVYETVTATLSGSSSHLNLTPYHKVSINDGTGATNYLITETRFHPNEDKVFLQLVEEA